MYWSWTVSRCQTVAWSMVRRPGWLLAGTKSCCFIADSSSNMTCIMIFYQSHQLSGGPAWEWGDSMKHCFIYHSSIHTLSPRSTVLSLHHIKGQYRENLFSYRNYWKYVVNSMLFSSENSPVRVIPCYSSAPRQWVSKKINFKFLLSLFVWRLTDKKLFIV